MQDKLSIILSDRSQQMKTLAGTKYRKTKPDYHLLHSAHMEFSGRNYNQASKWVHYFPQIPQPTHSP